MLGSAPVHFSLLPRTGDPPLELETLHALSPARICGMLPKADDPDLCRYGEGLNITKGKVLPG